MPVFEATGKIGNRKKYETTTKVNMSESNSSEYNSVMSAQEINTDNESEACILTQEEVDEKIGNYIAPWLDS